MIFELPLGDAENPSNWRVWEWMRQSGCLNEDRTQRRREDTEEEHGASTDEELRASPLCPSVLRLCVL